MPCRTLVVGDIHGCLRQFEALLHAIAITPDDHLVLLGDLIDRGPDSAGALKRVRQISAAHKVTTLTGNHEQMMLAARDFHDKFSDWLRNGGCYQMAEQTVRCSEMVGRGREFEVSLGARLFRECGRLRSPAEGILSRVTQPGGGAARLRARANVIKMRHKGMRHKGK